MAIRQITRLSRAATPLSVTTARQSAQRSLVRFAPPLRGMSSLKSALYLSQRAMSSANMETDEYIVFPREKVRAGVTSLCICHQLLERSSLIRASRPLFLGYSRPGSTTPSTGPSTKTV